MTTQLNLAPTVNVEFLQALAKEFKLDFERTSELLNESILGRRIIFNGYRKELYPFTEWDDESVGEVEPIIPIPEEIRVASTDSSCILIGETSDGALYAVRAAVSFASSGSVQSFFRIGPIIVYLSATGAYGLPGILSKYELRLSLIDQTIAERIIRNTVERKMIDSLLGSSERMIVMVDGSLKHPASAFDTHSIPRNSETSLIGFSKSSTLIPMSKASGMVSRAKGPAFYEIEDGTIKTVLAKFACDGLVFRLDLQRNNEIGKLLGEIIWNDAFTVGYPESLRVAHHLSVFSRAEDTALKAYVAKRYRLKQLPTFNLRRITLGSFSSAR
jgi:hypothetical protein